MVDANDGQRGGVLVILDLDGDSGVVEGGVDVVYGDWVVRVGGVTRDINDNTQLAARLCKELVVDERGHGLRQVDLIR